jgi:hypothetical protein
MYHGGIHYIELNGNTDCGPHFSNVDKGEVVECEKTGLEDVN